MLEVQLLAGAAEELGVLGVRARPAALDEAHAQAVDVPRDGQLVGDGEVEPLLLRAVAQRRVVDVEQVAGHRKPLVVWRSSGNKKTSRREQEVSAARRLVALVDNDAAVLHVHECATAVRRVGTPTGHRGRVVPRQVPRRVQTDKGRDVPRISPPRPSRSAGRRRWPLPSTGGPSDALRRDPRPGPRVRQHHTSGRSD